MNQRTILLTSVISAAVIASLALGYTLGRSPQLFGATAPADRQESRDAILDKLAQSAAQQQVQAQLPSALFAPFSQTPFSTDPFQQWQQMQSQMDQLFGAMSSAPSLFSLGGSGWGGGFQAPVQPDIEVEESSDEYRVVIAVAKDSDIELDTALEDNRLSINAKVRQEVRDTHNGRQLSSTSLSQFSREIPLSAPVDATGMHTEKSESSIVIRIPKLS